MPRILVVEDETTIAELVAEVLQDEGYEVVLAANGQEGLARLSEKPPDLILTDLMMPVLSGGEMCRMIAGMPTYQGIPIVVMSAGVNALPRLDCDFAAFVSKPFALDTLITTITTIVSPRH